MIYWHIHTSIHETDRESKNIGIALKGATRVIKLSVSVFISLLLVGRLRPTHAKVVNTTVHLTPLMT